MAEPGLPPSPPPSFPPPSFPPPPHWCSKGDEVLALASILTFFGAMLLALSMVVQRYALSYPEPQVPICGIKVRRSLAWFFGLVLYGTANGLCVPYHSNSSRPPPMRCRALPT